MFGSLGVWEIGFILVLALLLFGPKKLPEIGRQIGRGLGEFKRASNELKRQLNTEIADDEEADRVAARRRPPPPTPGTRQAPPAVESGGDGEPEPAAAVGTATEPPAAATVGASAGGGVSDPTATEPR